VCVVDGVFEALAGGADAGADTDTQAVYDGQSSLSKVIFHTVSGIGVKVELDWGLAAEASQLFHYVGCDGSNCSDQRRLDAPNPRHTGPDAIEFPTRPLHLGWVTTTAHDTLPCTALSEVKARVQMVLEIGLELAAPQELSLGVKT
jgi:hypothetical protein